MRPTVAALVVAFLAPLALLMVVLIGVVALLGPGTPGAGTPGSGALTGSGPVPGVSTQAAADIPPAYLALYQQAGTSCAGLDWALLAGIGKTETDHGRARLPGVLSGENFAGAGGPMQFLLPTFRDVVSRYPLPPGGAQPPSRYNPHDAIHTAAAYLCDSGLDTPTATPAEHADAVHDAVFTYNHSEDYVRTVVTRAARYRATAAQDEPNDPSGRASPVPTDPQRRGPASRTCRSPAPSSSSPTSDGRSRHVRRARRAEPSRPGHGRSARGPPDPAPAPPSTARRAHPLHRAHASAPKGPEAPLRPPTPHAHSTPRRNNMSSTHRDLGVSARFSWLTRLAGAVTGTAALTPGATTTASAATAETAFAGPSPDPDTHSDTRTGDRSDDGKGDSKDAGSETDSDAGSELESGPRGTTAPPARARGRARTWSGSGRYTGPGATSPTPSAGDWREAPYGGQLMVTSDVVWVEVTGGPLQLVPRRPHRPEALLEEGQRRRALRLAPPPADPVTEGLRSPELAPRPGTTEPGAAPPR